MVRFKKGSAEAKEWARKMRESRGVKGSGVSPPSRLPESSPDAEMGIMGRGVSPPSRLPESSPDAEMGIMGRGAGASIPFDMRRVPDDVFREMVSGLSAPELQTVMSMPSLTVSQRGIIIILLGPPPSAPGAPRVTGRKKMGRGLGAGMCPSCMGMVDEV
jgi:hypothetical protein